jgi:hypothetical protein
MSNGSSSTLAMETQGRAASRPRSPSAPLPRRPRFRGRPAPPPAAWPVSGAFGELELEAGAWTVGERLADAQDLDQGVHGRRGCATSWSWNLGAVPSGWPSLLRRNDRC